MDREERGRKYAHLVEDPTFKALYRTVLRGSYNTAAGRMGG